ncbi:LamG domain-containing protein [bacterium]|nr:LamG domain-containing protein [bacterium]
MKKLIVAAVLAMVFVVVGCTDSSGPDDVDGTEPPDIPGLVAFYHFDANLEDASGNGHDGTGTAGISYVMDHNGVAGSAVYIRGRNDTISVSNRGAFDFVGAFTVAGWIRADLESFGYCCVIDKGYDDGAWSVGTSGSAVPTIQPLRFYVGGSDYAFSVDDAVPFGQGIWMHFACSFNDTTNVARLYVNGAFARADTHDVDIVASGKDLWIGTSHWGDAFDGAIDQVALFGRVLSDAEVSELYDFE